MTDSTPDPPRMTAAEFEALAKLLFGDERTGWQAKTASLLGVNQRNVAYWAAEPPAQSKPIPEGVRLELLAEVARLMQDAGEQARMWAWVARHEAQYLALLRAMDGVPSQEVAEFY